MRYFIPLLFSLFIIACNNTSQQAADDKTLNDQKKTKADIPDFNADTAYFYIKAQLDFGPRVPNTPAHDKCAAFLIEKMSGFTANVQVQKGKVKAYNGTLLNFQNIIASWKPETNNRILLCAHWDSRPYADHDPDPACHRKPIDGANDGASGVGVLLEIARQLSIKQTEVGIDIILFDVEDYGPPQDQREDEKSEDFWGLGSQYWANHPHKSGYFARYGILLDMVGAPGATFLMEGISMQYAPEVVKNVWNTANRIGYSSYFRYEQGPSITDDHIPINKVLAIPTIDIIHLDKSSATGFYPYWHTTKDNLDAIDKATLKAVGQTLLTVVFEEQ